MNKNILRSYIVLGIVLLIYVMIAFVCPFHFTAIFFVSLVFGIISIGIQIYVINTAFNKGDGIKSKFYGFPIARLGICYMIIEILLSYILMALGDIIPMWISFIVQAIILAAAAVGLISAEGMRDEIERQDSKLKKDVAVMRKLQSITLSVSNQCDDSETAKDLKKLAESFKYSDIVSSEATADIEFNLLNYADELQQAVIDKEYDSAKALCKKMESSLVERNHLCKLNKN